LQQQMLSHRPNSRAVALASTAAAVRCQMMMLN
jgi:hypothetical protein